MVEHEQARAFRLARQGLDRRRAISLPAAAACPTSDFQRGSALLALAARAEQVTRDEYDRATDAGELVVAPTLRAALHALDPADFSLFGRGLLADDEQQLAQQLGRSVQRLLDETRIGARAALDEVAEATASALADGRALTKDELHEELRGRVRTELLPWCKGCGSHHVAPMLWRFGGVQAGMRCDAQRRYLLGDPGPAPEPSEAARRFLRVYGPATAKDFGAWAGLARAHARELWRQVEAELAEVRVEGERCWLLAEDEPALASPPPARGVRLLPPRDPYLQHPDRAQVAPDPALRNRLFRPVAGPGAVLQDGRLVGLWRVRARGQRTEVDVEELAPIDRPALEAEAERVAQLRGAEGAAISVRR